MKEYHKNWLKINPHRSKEWLEARLADGFDIHHLDGDNKNNTSNNLILLEGQDHMRLHSLSLSRIKAIDIRKRKIEERNKRDEAHNFIRGSFVSKTIKGKKYWYFQDNKTRKQKYIGRDSFTTRLIISNYNNVKEDYEKVSN